MIDAGCMAYVDDLRDLPKNQLIVTLHEEDALSALGKDLAKARGQLGPRNRLLIDPEGSVFAAGLQDFQNHGTGLETSL